MDKERYVQALLRVIEQIVAFEKGLLEEGESDADFVLAGALKESAFRLRQALKAYRERPMNGRLT